MILKQKPEGPHELLEESGEEMRRRGEGVNWEEGKGMRRRGEMRGEGGNREKARRKEEQLRSGGNKELLCCKHSQEASNQQVVL